MERRHPERAARGQLTAWQGRGTVPTMSNPPVVESHDQRGTADAPYGYVYFKDGTRLSYAPGTSGLSNPLGLFPSKGWKPETVRTTHYKAATDYLASKGIS